MKYVSQLLSGKENNDAVYGAGMFFNPRYSGKTEPIITNCIFRNNTGTGGGGVQVTASSSNTISLSFINCLFYSNYSLRVSTSYSEGKETAWD